MNHQRILDTLSDIFVDIFDDSSIVIDRSTSAEQIEAWDSLNHVNLLAAVEASFGIEFTLNEMRELRNVGDMVDLIHQLLND